jgi:transcriptional regulator with XRE-family HTH domain
MALRQEKVSQRLRELRELQGLSQEDAARKVGITQRQWQRWESGESMPYPRSLDMVASAFEISVAEFFDPPQPIASDPSQLDRIEALRDPTPRRRYRDACR